MEEKVTSIHAEMPKFEAKHHDIVAQYQELCHLQAELKNGSDLLKTLEEKIAAKEATKDKLLAALVASENTLKKTWVNINLDITTSLAALVSSENKLKQTWVIINLDITTSLAALVSSENKLKQTWVIINLDITTSLAALVSSENKLKQTWVIINFDKNHFT